jgi:uncharacterized membrane protein
MLKKCDNAIMITNGFLLMLVALVPFPTKTLGLFLQTGALQTAVIFYTGYFVLISVAFRVLWYVASRDRGRLIEGITPKQIKQTTRNENFGLVCNTAVMGVAFISPVAALVLSFVMWIYWIVFA